MESLLRDKFYSVDDDLFSIIDDAKDYAVHKGFAMRPLNKGKDSRVHLPFCLLPSEFSSQWFHYACEIQPYMNLVLHKIAYSGEFLKRCLVSLVEVDEFIRKIFEIFESVYEDQKEQVNLGLFRCDYLLTEANDGSTQMKQVENNTIASGFCGISPIMRDLHLFIMNKLGATDIEDRLPKNRCDFEMAKGMKLAWDIYGNPDAVIIFVVEESTFNICDQRILEYQVINLQPLIKVKRYTFKDLRGNIVLKDKKLFIKCKEVALVYYRVGYAPNHYEPEDWDTRLLIERSCAIKCPSVGYQLAGTKRVQCFLSKEGILEQFVDAEIARKLRKVFAYQCLLNSEVDNKTVSLAIENPELFVLKPEREGGGNNMYGNNLKNQLIQTQHSVQRKAFILMEYIKPLSYHNCIIQSNENPKFCSVVSELGTYGAILGNKDIIHANYYAGHLLRSRDKDLDEGGVAAGFGALDFCQLV